VFDYLIHPVMSPR